MSNIVHCTHCKSGFTLIELSIVLVIIGLIVGGIVVGRDLIKAAEVRAQVSQIDKINTSVNVFRDKYGGLPGDLVYANAQQFGFFIPSSCSGAVAQRDGNGLIDGHPFPQQLAAVMNENGLFWNDLSTSKLIDGQFTVPSGNSACVATMDMTSTTLGKYLPAAKMGGDNYLHVYEANGQNWLMLAHITSVSQAAGGLYATPNIPVGQAYNIDAKMDDGSPTTGSVTAVYINGSQTATSNASNAPTDSGTTCYNTTGPAYSITYNNGSGTNCALSFKFR